MKQKRRTEEHPIIREETIEGEKKPVVIGRLYRLLDGSWQACWSSGSRLCATKREAWAAVFNLPVPENATIPTSTPTHGKRIRPSRAEIAFFS